MANGKSKKEKEEPMPLSLIGTMGHNKEMKGRGKPRGKGREEKLGKENGRGRPVKRRGRMGNIFTYDSGEDENG